MGLQYIDWDVGDVTVINLSGQAQSVTFQDRLYHGRYTEYFSKQAKDLDESTRLELAPWSYMVFVQ